MLGAVKLTDPDMTGLKSYAHIFAKLPGEYAEGARLFAEEQAAEQIEQETRRQTATASEAAQKVMIEQAYRSKANVLERRKFEVGGGQ